MKPKSICRRDENKQRKLIAHRNGDDDDVHRTTTNFFLWLVRNSSAHPPFDDFCYYTVEGARFFFYPIAFGTNTIIIMK